MNTLKNLIKKITTPAWVRVLQERLPTGTRIRLERMRGQCVPDGTCGTVMDVDRFGTIRMRWDNGSDAFLAMDADSFHTI